MSTEPRTEPDPAPRGCGDERPAPAPHGDGPGTPDDRREMSEPLLAPRTAEPPDPAPREAAAPVPTGSSGPADAPDLVRVEHLTKSFGRGGARTTVLDDITLRLGGGEICALLGPSGSGKSTFLNLVGGLEPADSGTVVVDGEEVTALAGRRLVAYRRRMLGFVFQFYNLVPDLTVRENIEVCACLVPEPLDVDGLLRDLGLWEHRDKLPRQVSGGQQQRCAIGRALVKKPDLLLCDEPTGALDHETSKEVLGVLERVNRIHGCTIVIVTHNDAIGAMAHRTLRLRDGRLVQNEVAEHPVAASELEW